MEVIEQSNFIDIFLSNYAEAEAYLALYGNEGSSKNKGVTLSYAHASQSDPLFIWFSAAVLGSDQVGTTIGLADYPILNHCQSTQTLSQGFAWGNQAIHNNIMALYHTYQDTSISGLEAILENDLHNLYITEYAIKAFTLYSSLEEQIVDYAKSQNIAPTDLKAIKHVLNQPENFEMLKDASLALVAHEQKIVTPMYDKVFFDGGKTVGEVLADTNFMEKFAADSVKIGGAKILDKYIPIDAKDLPSFEKRISYFNEVFDEYFYVLSQEGGLEKLILQRDSIISAIDVDFMEYGKHFVNDHSEDFAFLKDWPINRWKIVSDFTLPNYESAPQFGQVSYNDAAGRMFLPRDYPLEQETFFYRDDIHRVFGITGNWPFMYPQLLMDGRNGSWTLLKYIWVPHEVTKYAESADNPFILNYTEYLLWVRDEPVKKEVLLSWLGNYIVEDPDFIYPEELVPESAPVSDSFASNIHNHPYVLRSPAMKKNIDLENDFLLNKIFDIKMDNGDLPNNNESLNNPVDSYLENEITSLEFSQLIFDSKPLMTEEIMINLNKVCSTAIKTISNSNLLDVLELSDIISFKEEDILPEEKTLSEKQNISENFLLREIELPFIVPIEILQEIPHFYIGEMC